MSWDGKVTESFTDRLQRSVRNGTGYLEVHDTARERRGWVFLEDRDVVAVLVDGYQPRLARRLTASEFVSVADMGEVLTVTKDEYDPRIAVECVARGLIDAVTMKVVYREFMLSAASFVDEWELGDSQWVAGVPPWEGRSTAVPVPLLVRALIRRKEHWARLWTQLSVVTIPDRVPVRTGTVDYQPESPDEAAVLWAVNGKRTVDQVAGECGFTRFQTGHLMAALTTKKVLDLFPVNGPRSTSEFLRVEAGYYAASEPFPEVNVPPGDVYTGRRPPSQVGPPRSWVVPMAISALPPPEADPDSTHSTQETTQIAVTGPVTADDPEGNVVTQHVEVEDAGGAVESAHPTGDVRPVAPVRSGGGAGEPQRADAGEVQFAATDETVDGLNREPDVGTGNSRWGEASQSATNLGEFFVTSPPRPAAVPDRPPALAGVQQHNLPPLPAITGGPSEFYAVLPSMLPRRPGGVLATLLTGLPVAEHAAEHEPGGSDPTTPGETQAERKPELDLEREAAGGSDSEQDMEVTRLRDELLRLATDRRTAAEKAAVLREQAGLHSAHADAVAVQVEEAGRSVARLTNVTSEASATAVRQREGLQFALNEEVRLAALRAQVDEDMERARKALVLSQRKFDESSAAHANLERDLHLETARRETVFEAWTAATAGAVLSAANACHAEAAGAECDQLIEEARQRLTELANAADR